MTREQAEKEIRDNFTEVWADGIIKALEQEPTQSPIIDWNNCHTSEQLNNISATKNDLGVDLISRADVNQVIEDYMDEQYAVLSDRTRERAFGAKVVMARINELPSVTPQEPRWIPVNEKLPNDRDWYLGIFKEPDTGWINPLPFICDYVGRETKATTRNCKKEC